MVFYTIAEAVLASTESFTECEHVTVVDKLCSMGLENLVVEIDFVRSD